MSNIVIIPKKVTGKGGILRFSCKSKIVNLDVLHIEKQIIDISARTKKV